jgi:hypothetical protein
VPSHPGQNGSFTGFSSDLSSNGGLSYDEITIQNDVNTYSTLGLGAIYEAQRGPLPAGTFVYGRTPRNAPFTNFTANNLTPAATLETQIYELGNSLGQITGNIPSGGIEPGQPFLDCYNHGGLHP